MTKLNKSQIIIKKHLHFVSEVWGLRHIHQGPGMDNSVGHLTVQ